MVVVRWLNHKSSSCANERNIQDIKEVCGHGTSTIATIRDVVSVAGHRPKDITALMTRELDACGSVELRPKPLMVDVVDMWVHLCGRRHSVNA